MEEFAKLDAKLTSEEGGTHRHPIPDSRRQEHHHRAQALQRCREYGRPRDTDREVSRRAREMPEGTLSRTITGNRVHCCSRLDPQRPDPRTSRQHIGRDQRESRHLRRPHRQCIAELPGVPRTSRGGAPARRSHRATRSLRLRGRCGLLSDGRSLNVDSVLNLIPRQSLLPPGRSGSVPRSIASR